MDRGSIKEQHHVILLNFSYRQKGKSRTTKGKSFRMGNNILEEKKEEMKG
jgi:hypothetical protein